MKGIVFNLLEEVVRREHGADTWDRLLERSSLEGAYTSLGTYPDSELMRMVGVASEALGQSQDDVMRWFGRGALPILALRYPGFFPPESNTRSFALTLNEVIHPEVRKIYPGAQVPEFTFLPSPFDQLVMRYTSTRRLCAFAEGLLQGAAAHYHEAVDLHQPECMHRGDTHCTLVCSFRGLPAKV